MGDGHAAKKLFWPLDCTSCLLPTYRFVGRGLEEWWANMTASLEGIKALVERSDA